MSLKKNAKVTRFVTFYQEKYIRIYSDLTSFVAVKPSQILIENENINSHLVVYLSEPTSKKGIENLDKAYNHLVRCTIDASKMLWIEMKKHLEQEFKRFNISKYSYNLSESELLDNYSKFLSKGQEARKNELNGVGKTPEMCIDDYYQAIEYAWAIIKNHDRNKAKSFGVFRIYQWIKGNIIQIIASFLIGIFASCASINLDLIYSLFTSKEKSQTDQPNLNSKK
ncbi:hypothetical protein LEP1GSC202_0436 [Leptospira yanagawae serovar Saopaulo str. Sao Paulo = ATCC 700523]|uniref:Uncharacterized protein n=1 Tax=Leptospira yanagawae serovar Saopaulo str. Sao Paulo = ATCC 700523 TaxID=1249483 RepID=A0A5E8HIE4_9LEPT|nr:hypothetical protein [Leptospira yanagawae]EOQ90742.1 hypothetical protein LEP1GSC202_0436 [Leptospira yanagawae serovar Saopaulo str. Sao Paulo = ATCC 700523]